MHPESIIVRFWKKVDTSGGLDACWLWTGTGNGRGYGTLSRGRRGEGRIYAHRLSWEIAHGSIPNGLLVCHHCDTPACVNPRHLFLGTTSANMQDSISKGRFHRNPLLGDDNHASKLTAADIPTVRALAASGMSHKTIAKQYGVTGAAISYAVRRVTWKHIP